MMAIPDYQTLMLPLLSLISDGKEYVFNPLVDVLADEFNLTELERQQLLPSGAMTTIKNRAGWARTYLKKAGLLDQPSRGVIKITQIGSGVLNNKPQKIDVKFLEQYESFVTFRDASKLEAPNVAIEASPTFKVLEALSTPEEILANTHQKLNAQLASELLETIKVGTPDFYERLVVKVLVSMGYGGTLANAARVIGRSGDGGIDGIIDEDRLGLDSIYIQAKSINRPGYYYRRHSNSETEISCPDAKQKIDWFRLIQENEAFSGFNLRLFKGWDFEPDVNAEVALLYRARVALGRRIFYAFQRRFNTFI